MPDYKKRRIELIPKRRTDWTWQCPYTIIEFRPTCWAYHKGCPDGGFTSRQEAATAALEEAKRIVDSLEPLSQAPLSGSGVVLRAYWNRMRRLLFSLVRSVICIGNIVPRNVFVLRFIAKQ
jgi:hypothetical protein